jgi:hypothetical protein
MSNMGRERKHSRTTQHYHFKFTISSYHCRGHVKETRDIPFLSLLPYSCKYPSYWPNFLSFTEFCFSIVPTVSKKTNNDVSIKEKLKCCSNLTFFTLYNTRIPSKLRSTYKSTHYLTVWIYKYYVRITKISHKTMFTTYFYSKTNQMHNISNLFYYGTILYMFRKVSPSIIRSLRLYIQHQVYVIQVLLSAC